MPIAEHLRCLSVENDRKKSAHLHDRRFVFICVNTSLGECKRQSASHNRWAVTVAVLEKSG